MTNQKNKTDFGGSVNNICSKTLLKKISPLVCVEKQWQHAQKKLKEKNMLSNAKKALVLASNKKSIAL